MVPTPTTPKGVSQQEALYRGMALSFLDKLKQTNGHLKMYSGSMRLDNGVVIYCNVCFNKVDFQIAIPPVVNGTTEIVEEIVMPNFLYTPRMFGINDGYERIDKVLTARGDGSVEYPLSDPKTSQGLYVGTTRLTIKREKMLFGNIDWIGKNTAAEGKPSNAPVLTWKGPTGRLIPFDTEKPISGLTQPDIKFSEDDPDKVTCFGTYIYQNGRVAFVAPSSIKADDGSSIAIDIETKVLGAARTACQIEGKDRNALVCIVVNHYAQLIGFYEEVWVSKGDRALYDATEHPLGWRKLNSKMVGRPTAIWAFNQSGNKATQQSLEYVIDVDGATVTQTMHDAGTGSYTTSTGDGTTTISHSGTYKSYSDYKGDERVVATITIVDTNTTTLTATNTDTKVDAPIYYLGVLGATVTVSFDDNQARAVMSGTYCSCAGVWSISAGTISESGVIDSSSTCGTATVTYTCGAYHGSAEYRMSSGVWLTTSITAHGDGTYGTGGLTYTDTNGGTQTIYRYLGGCGINIRVTQTTYPTYITCGQAGGCLYPGANVNSTISCNDTHGYSRPPVPDLSSGSCQSYPDHCIYNCANGQTSYVAQPDNIYCYYLTHTEVKQWVCL